LLACEIVEPQVDVLTNDASGTVSLIDTATWSVSQSRWGKTEAAWPLPRTGNISHFNLREQGAARLEKIAKTSKLSGDAVRALLDF
jgi:hypothetical protein